MGTSHLRTWHQTTLSRKMPRRLTDGLDYGRAANIRQRNFGYNVNKSHYRRRLEERRMASERLSLASRELFNDIVRFEEMMPTVRVTITGLNEGGSREDTKTR